MAEEKWARLQDDAKTQLRRGAWYRVLRLGAREAVLDVGRHPLSLSRSLLQFSSAPPAEWTVVQDTRNPATGMPPVRSTHAVCPNCRRRVPLTEFPSAMRCPGCNGLFEVAWVKPASQRRHEAQKRDDNGGANGPLHNRRLARRRQLASRRLLADRRFADRRLASPRVSRGRRRMVERRQLHDRRNLLDRRRQVRQEGRETAVP